VKKLLKWNLLRVFCAALFMAVAVGGFFAVSGRLVGIFHWQAAPALLSLAAGGALGAAVAAGAIVVVTLLFGRFYCSFFCPFGIFQDFVGWVARAKRRQVPNLGWLRYAIFGLTAGMLAGGWTTGLLLFDPYSNSGRMAIAFLSGGFVVALVIIALVVWKKRVYCTAICPVGTFLGLLAKFGVSRLRFTEKCVKCGQCVKVCKTGCLDPKAGTVDNERCVRCLNCLTVCRFGGIRLGAAKAAVPTDVSRRAFLINGGIVIAGAAAGAALAKTGMGKLLDILHLRDLVPPPGAGSLERFASKCTACCLCVENCPGRVIAPAPGGIGPVRMEFSRGFCRYNCNRCSNVCPTGALMPLTKEVKQRTKIAEARFDARNCIVFQEGTPCGKCADACPTGAIRLRKNGTPRPVDAAKCIGCGACQFVCPAVDKAMRVEPIEEQQLLS